MLRPPEASPLRMMGNGSWCKERKRKENKEKEKSDSCALCAGESYAAILKTVKHK